MIFTFKQKSEESFKEAWSRIYDWHGKTEPKMTLSLLLSCFYFGLALRYRYALDTTVEGDFLYCDGDQAFNIIKKLITIYSMPTDFDSSLVSIFYRLNTLETHTASLNTCYSTLRQHFDYRDFYFRDLGSLVVLSFPQLLSFSSVLSKPLSETLSSAVTASCPMGQQL
jgi:hypothetical protein